MAIQKPVQDRGMKPHQRIENQIARVEKRLAYAKETHQEDVLDYLEEQLTICNLALSACWQEFDPEDETTWPKEEKEYLVWVERNEYRYTPGTRRIKVLRIYAWGGPYDKWPRDGQFEQVVLKYKEITPPKEKG